MIDQLTPKIMIEAFEYQPESGTFSWKKRPSCHFESSRAEAIFRSRYEGEEAFTSITLAGYLQCRVMGKLVLAHRAAFAIMTKQWPPEQVDHINGDRSDNRWSNLRLADQSVNSRNMAMPTRNTSGRVGISFDKNRNKWMAQGRADGRQYNLGRFEDFQDAVAARVRFENEHHFHQNHGRLA